MAKSLNTLNSEIEAMLQDTTNVSFTEAQIRQALNVGIGALGTMWYQEERLMPIAGTGSHPIRVPADCRTNDGIRAVIFTTDVGRSVVKKFTSPSTYTSYMSETDDGVITTVMDVSNLGTSDFLYFGANRRFASATIRMSTDPMSVNVNSATLSGQYYSADTGDWASLTLLGDGTEWNNRTLAKDGIVSWVMRDDWIPTTVDGVQAYYVRLAVSSALSSSVKIAEIRFDTAVRHREYYWEDWTQVGDYLTLHNLGNLGDGSIYTSSSTAWYLKLVYEAPFYLLPTYAAINDADGITAIDTSVTIDAGTGGADGTLWPEMGYCEIDSEIMRYHKSSATAFWIERGKFGTRAASHSDDTPVYPVFPGTDAQAELVKKMAFAWLLGELQVRRNIGSDYMQQYLAVAKQQRDEFYQMLASGLYRQRSLPLIRRAR